MIPTISSAATLFVTHSTWITPALLEISSVAWCGMSFIALSTRSSLEPMIYSVQALTLIGLTGALGRRILWLSTAVSFITSAYLLNAFISSHRASHPTSKRVLYIAFIVSHLFLRYGWLCGAPHIALGGFLIGRMISISCLVIGDYDALSSTEMLYNFFWTTCLA